MWWIIKIIYSFIQKSTSIIIQTDVLDELNKIVCFRLVFGFTQFNNTKDEEGISYE